MKPLASPTFFPPKNRNLKKMSLLSSNGRFFKTEDGRIIMLRGVNLSGAVKQPFSPLLPSHEPIGFYDGTNMSFVSRPFPLSEANTHFRRLASWGFNFLRFNITWEAVEHAGPGVYDFEYLTYLVEILKEAKKHGFRCFIDPHQDVVSSSRLITSGHDFRVVRELHSGLYKKPV